MTIIAVRSGFAQDPSTWLFGILPFANCSIVIPVGITVIWARPALIFPLLKIEIFGVVAFGSGQSSFTCNFPIKIDVRGGGRIQDLTSNKLLILQERSLIIVRTGGSFGVVGTVIRTSSSTGGSSSITVDNTAGPLTCATLSGGLAVSYKRIAFIAIQNGDLSSPSCYLNDEAPSAEACDGGCALYVSSGVRLSLASLVGGVLNINFAIIDVVASAILELGAAGLECPFPIQINIRGILAAIGGRVRVRLPGGNGDSCGLNFFGDGRLDSALTVIIQIFNRITGIDIGDPVDLPVGLIAPYFIFTSITGLIEISIIGIQRILNCVLKGYTLYFIQFRPWWRYDNIRNKNLNNNSAFNNSDHWLKISLKKLSLHFFLPFVYFQFPLTNQTSYFILNFFSFATIF